jgi:hypothetical protein
MITELKIHWSQNVAHRRLRVRYLTLVLSVRELPPTGTCRRYRTATADN